MKLWVQALNAPLPQFQLGYKHQPQLLTQLLFNSQHKIFNNLLIITETEIQKTTQKAHDRWFHIQNKNQKTMENPPAQEIQKRTQKREGITNSNKMGHR